MRSVWPWPMCELSVTSPAAIARSAARVTHAGADGGLKGAAAAVSRKSCRSGMCSSSTASTTWPRASAASISRMFAARMSCSVAASSDETSWAVICDRITANNPPPNNTRMSPNVAAYQAVRPSRMRVSGCIDRSGLPEPVARAAHRVDEARREALVDLAPQPPDEYFEHVGERIVVVVPHVRRNRRAIDDFSLVLQKELEQRVLLAGEHDLRSGAPDAVGAEIHLEVLDAPQRWLETRLTSRECVDAREQLAKRERLHEVVVGAGLQTADAIVDGAPRREHQDGRRDVAAAHLRAEVEAASARQHDVEDDDIVRVRERRIASVGERVHDHRVDMLFAQPVAQNARELGIIFND